MNYEKLPYRMGVGIMLINDKKEVFTGRRIDTRSEAWQMPQGGIDKGEVPSEAVFREMEEEIGTNKAEIIAQSEGWYSYDLPKRLVPNLWGGKYRGQKQKWFIMRFTGDDSDINIETKHPEFCQWKWIKADILTEVIVPFKKQLYSEVMEEFKQYL